MKISYIILFLSGNLFASYNSQNTIIAFDLNDVLVQKDVPAITRKASAFLLKPKTWRYALSPFFWNKLVKYATEKHCKETIFMKLVKDYPALADFEEEYIDLATSHTVDPEAFQLVKQLKASGYRLYIFSNMGAKCMARMSQKYPELFNLFEAYYCPGVDNNYNCKPYTSFYNEFKEFVAKRGDKDKQIIFVDDRKKNIKVAEQVGFKGIVCSSIKNVCTEMQNLNVLSDVPTRNIKKNNKFRKTKKSKR